MPKFSVDLDSVINTMSKRSFKLSEVKDKIEKVAFDVVRFKNGNAEELWQIQTDEDGNDYIIALYNDEDEKIATASVQNPWSVAVKNDALHMFYKQDYLCKVAAEDVGFSESDLLFAKRFLPKRLAENKKLVSSLLKSLDPDVCKKILSKYPELA